MTKRKFEILVILLILTVAFHPITDLILSWCFNANELYETIGPKNYSYVWDTFSIIMPLCLCLTSLKRSGLVIGTLKKNYKKTILICLLPIILTLVVYPFTSKPFSNTHLGIWLISPIAQDLFWGYTYGVFDEFFPKEINISKLKIKQAIPLLAIFAALWHLPNFQNIETVYVVFQLIYVFLFTFWIYLTRQWTGSIIPAWITHVCINFISWWI